MSPRRIMQLVAVRKFETAQARSHELQSKGIDYQEAASVAAAENGIDPLGDDYPFLTTSSGPGCLCSFCKEAFKDCQQDPYDSGDYDC